VLALIGWNLTSLRTSNKATCWLNQTVGTVLRVLALLGPSCISGLMNPTSIGLGRLTTSSISSSFNAWMNPNKVK
jgi:hypothetical protein